MKRAFFLFLIVALPIFCFGQIGDLNQKLPIDKTIRVGKLDNGMTYFIKKASNPKERGEFYIVHNVGAMQENDDQNGLAHFLEHMAFNGTKNFPGKNMLNYLASIGVRFGYNVNAYTSRERTVYNISNVPLIRSTIIDSVLLALHDWSYYISCEPAEIEAERGVIREEWRLGDNTRSRMVRKANEFQYRGSKYTQRNVIGLPEVINNFQPATLVNFYHKWYRPDLQAIVLVGDFDVDNMEKRVIKEFSSIPKAVNPTPKEIYTVPDNQEPIVGIITDPETRASSVKLLYKLHGPTPEQKLTSESIYNSMVTSLIVNIFGTKLDAAKDGANPPFKTNAAVLMSGSANLNFLQLTFSPVGDDYLKALKGVLTEVERAKKYGYTQEDLVLAKTGVAKKLDAVIEKFDKRKNEEFVPSIIEHFTMGEALTTDEFRKNREKEILESVTLDQINENISKLFTDWNRIVLISAPEKDSSKLPDEKAILKVIADKSSYDIKPYINPSDKKDLAPDLKLTDSPIVSEKKWEKYGFTEWTLQNGVKVYWYKRSEPNSKITLRGESKGGVNYLKENELGNARVLEYAQRVKGLANLNDKDLKIFLADKNVNMMTILKPYTEYIFGAAASKDADLFFKMLYLNFTSVNFNEESFKKMMERQKEMLVKTAASKTRIFMDSTIAFKFGNNPYTKPLKVEDLDNANIESIKKIYDDRFSNAADFTFFLMGPQTDAEIKPLIEKYFGSLPVAKGREKYNTRGISLIKGIKEMKYYDTTMVTPKSQISITYHGKMAYNQKNLQTLYLLRYVLSDRYLKSIREDKGGAYYVGVDSHISSEPINNVELSVGFETDPKLRDELIVLVQKDIDDLVAKGPRENEIKDALIYLQKTFKDREKDSDYWFGRFSEYILNGVDVYDNEETEINKITTKDIQKLAAELFKQGNKLTFIYGSK